MHAHGLASLVISLPEASHYAGHQLLRCGITPGTNGLAQIQAGFLNISCPK